LAPASVSKAEKSPGVQSDVLVCLRVLARTGKSDCRRPCASFLPSSASTAITILCVARWQSARGMIEWLRTHERWRPDVVIIFGAAAYYRRATVGSSHDDEHPDNSTLHPGAVRPTPALWRAFCSYRPARAMAVRKYLKCCLLFREFRARV
jgi:hypothetical protein